VKIQWVTPTGVPNRRGVGPIFNFGQIASYMSKTVEDRRVLSTKCMYLRLWTYRLNQMVMILIILSDLSIPDIPIFMLAAPSSKHTVIV